MNTGIKGERAKEECREGGTAGGKRENKLSVQK